jgi:predicted DNA-binding transcriptional regulator AlpA
MEATMTLPSLLTVRDLVLLLKKKKSWIYAHTETGEIPSIRLPGGGYAFDPRDIASWIERLKTKPAKVISIKREE